MAKSKGVVTESALRLAFDAFNNQTEYEALLVGLRITQELGVKRLKAFIGSQLVARQVWSEYATQEPIMVRYLQKLQG